MKNKINVANLLKGMPKGMKLYDWLHNLEVELDEVAITEIETVIWCTKKDEDYNELFGYSRLGTLRGWSDGLQILFPSKEMQDWSKFSWKKGDVLVSKYNVYIIFEKFEDDTYTRFKGKHYLWKECNEEDYNKEETKMLTSVFEKANDNAAQTYINTIEKRLGGKLNRETLKIEKTQPEFKDGDFVYYTSLDGDKCIGIVKETKNDAIVFHVDYNLGTHSMDFNVSILKENFEFYKSNDLDNEIALNEALYIRHKSWNKEKNILEELKPKIELKPFDKVLVRDREDEVWEPAFFFRNLPQSNGYNYQTVGGEWRAYCIPYIGNESLLGTTKDVEG